jgi:gas vesicle protein GvpL/GvpF
MSTADATTKAAQQQDVAYYVYGIVPADVEITSDARGLDDREVRLIRYGDIGALVSEISVRDTIGRPEDLAAHEQLLDATAPESPVLPFRFGAVMSNEEAVAQELLAANHDSFANALNELEGRTEYIVKGRYDEKAILEEVLAENQEAAGLRSQLRGQDEMATRDIRIRLGELIHEAVAAKRAADTNELAEALSAHSVAAAELAPTHEYDAIHLAFLVETTRRDSFEKRVDEVARERQGRITFRLLGPLAPYDFVVTQG